MAAVPYCRRRKLTKKRETKLELVLEDFFDQAGRPMSDIVHLAFDFSNEVEILDEVNDDDRTPVGKMFKILQRSKYLRVIRLVDIVDPTPYFSNAHSGGNSSSRNHEYWSDEDGGDERDYQMQLSSLIDQLPVAKVGDYLDDQNLFLEPAEEKLQADILAQITRLHRKYNKINYSP